MGPGPDFVRCVLEKYVNGERGLAARLRWNTERSKDFSCTAEAICIINKILNIHGTPEGVKCEYVLSAVRSCERLAVASQGQTEGWP